MKPNRLINEPSPYLQQHAYNPVDWYPWGDEAFNKAAAENKPVFLSVGYSTCHWCHVMERESFENEDVGTLLNESFVAIKVDREERPDIDSIYMTVCQMMTRRGGWPLTILMTPDKKPFYAATYIPRESRGGHLGMLDFLPQVAEVWNSRQDEIYQSADHLTNVLAEHNSANERAGDIGPAVISTAVQQLVSGFDTKNGGFDGAPKFPMPHKLLFLLRHWDATGSAGSLMMVEKTLTAMRLGGMYDQVGFGFHRYSTDDRWFLPHFEKMLYDQALLVRAYLEAWQATGRPLYRSTAREILEYVQRDLTDPAGGFYSAEDADSEGEEGKFYLWSDAELRFEFGDAYPVWSARFNTRPEGNYHDEASGQATGTNLLHLERPLTDEENTAWQVYRANLFETRERRVHPHKDDKILTDWNGLMIATMAYAGRVLKEQSYAESARNAALFILDSMRDENGLLVHRYRNGIAGLQPTLDDYSFLIWGLLELYQTDFSADWLRHAIDLEETKNDLFRDQVAGDYFMTPTNGEKLIIRPKDAYDGATPSGIAVAYHGLIMLGRLTGDLKYEERASEIAAAQAGSINRSPLAHMFFLTSLQTAIAASSEVVIVGDRKAEATQSMLDALSSKYLPNTVIHQIEGDEIADLVPFTASMNRVNGKTTAYVCANFACQVPTTDVKEMLRQLGKMVA